MTIFFVSLFFFFCWLESQADYPHTDEYQSLLSALGFPVYTPTLYVRFLSFFADFFPDFPSLVRFNFIASQCFLALCFFFYHLKKKISIGTNLVVTAILSMATINVALTRKMHFWAAGFFFLILFLADFFSGKKKNLFLVFSFLLLGFFRVEFFLSALAALFIWLSPHLDRRKKIGLLLAGTFVVVSAIAQFGYGMKELLRESFHLEGNPDVVEIAATWAKLFFSNMGLHLFYSVTSLMATFRMYFFTLSLALLLLFPLVDNFKGNALRTKQIFLNEIFPYWLPASCALFSIRFIDFYVITTFVFLMSTLAFLLNSKKSKVAAWITLGLVLSAFFVRRPDFKESAYINFPSYLRGGTVHRQTFDLISRLEMKPGIEPYKILFNQYVAGVLPYENREYFQFADLKKLCVKGTLAFDIVLLPGKWFTVPEQDLLESCVYPSLSPMKHIKIAPGYDLYVSSRITSEKMPLK